MLIFPNQIRQVRNENSLKKRCEVLRAKFNINCNDMDIDKLFSDAFSYLQ